ncbi:MAG: cache domain-containing protein [Pseudodesulfovibrio sp.]
MKASRVILCCLFIIVMAVGTASAEKAPQKVYDLAESTLAKVGMDPLIVAAVKAQNGTSMSLADIQAVDTKWKARAGVADYMVALMDSTLGRHLKGIQASEAYYSEIFVMDNQGANVGMTNKTSDYWQGDEKKFKNSFAAGKGAVFVDEVAYDDSSQAYLVQVSVPVMDGGKAIGAITFGIDVDMI